MPKTTYRLKPETLKADLETLAALRRMPDYAPVNAQVSLASLEHAATLLNEAQERSDRADDEALAARDALHLAEWFIHDLMLLGKTQVQAQYGFDSDEVQAIGLKKKSKRRPNMPRGSAKSRMQEAQPKVG
jgi:hypothetical protein